MNKLIAIQHEERSKSSAMTQKLEKTQDECEIEWNSISEQAWIEHFCRIKRSNLLQCPDYARAMARLNNQRVRRGVIKIKGEYAGVLQVLEAGILRNAVHAVLLDRGPLWFDGRGGAHDFRLFLHAFSKAFPKRMGRRIRFIPEMENSDTGKALLEEYGYKRVSKHGYQTIWLNLQHDLDALRRKLNPKWRNKLKKAEKQGVEVVWSGGGMHFAWLIQNYAIDKAERKYDGPSLKAVMGLAKEFSRGQNMLIGCALLDGEPIAAILLFIHGSSATYQIGYTSDVGREKCAHHLLLWGVMMELKKRNIDDFDLGGVNDENAKGVKSFKEGLGGKLYETLGHYC